MRFFILFFAVSAFCSQSYGQKRCPQFSRLYTFYKGNEPRLFTDSLGRHPEFPFLQKIHGVTSPSLFIKAIRDTAKQHKYAREFKAFDLLLRNSGFTHGYKDLHIKNVTKVFISPGTIGNLGFYNNEKDIINYEYVILSPAGEDPAGTSAWKLTNASGCFLYILHTCGNGWYPNESASGGCKTVSLQTQLQIPEQQKDSVERPVLLSIKHYEATLMASSRRRKPYDTLVKLIRQKDSLVYVKDKNIIPWKLQWNNQSQQIRVCRDTSIRLNIPVVADSAGQTDRKTPIAFTLADTVYKKEKTKLENTCNSKWEIAVDVGKSFNTIPRLNDPTQHTQTDGAHPSAELAISRIFNPWFQLGISASYIVLSYQDDILYPGTVPDTYNSVYLGKPIIPVQLFGKFTIGKPIGFQSNISLSFGYSIPTNGKIENGGNTLSTNPNMKGDFTAGLKLGVAYFFSCHFGVCLSFTGQYFNNKGNLTNYNIFALPVNGGIRVRL
ncbi:MAG: hypothetical protein Q8939_15680 [Bacteroidota bacterium]|nr:hypothetical protein [Bacteroidota bacterium]